jgi:D-alanyl-D-alanine dipeptidase
MHNYGIAVDLTIVDDKGVPLDMGTGIDYFKSLSQPRLDKNNNFSQGKLTTVNS